MSNTVSLSSSNTPDSTGSLFPNAISAGLSNFKRLLAAHSAPPMEYDLFASPPSIIWKSTQASAFDLQRHAWQRLGVIRAQGLAFPTPEALSSLSNVITSLVQDNGPTPQLGATPDGSVEVQWLVDGLLVSALFEESGDYNVYAANSLNEIVLDDDVAAGALPYGVVESLASLLREMSMKITQRVPSWTEHG